MIGNKEKACSCGFIRCFLTAMVNRVGYLTRCTDLSSAMTRPLLVHIRWGDLMKTGQESQSWPGESHHEMGDCIFNQLLG